MLPSQADDAASISEQLPHLSQTAQREWTLYSRAYSIILLKQASDLAAKRHSREITPAEIRDAEQMINLDRRRTSPREAAITAGSICLGAALQGFITELGQSPLRPVWLTTYAALGALGFVLLIIGFAR